VAREAGSWKWAIGQFLFMSGFAYLASLLVFQGGRLLGF
jgi:ferrous iron transport protein B